MQILRRELSTSNVLVVISSSHPFVSVTFALFDDWFPVDDCLELNLVVDGLEVLVDVVVDLPLALE
jgi:hypothetical protein